MTWKQKYTTAASTDANGNTSVYTSKTTTKSKKHHGKVKNGNEHDQLQHRNYTPVALPMGNWTEWLCHAS